MQEEIKEILEFDFESQGERIEINEYERNILKDYITNLQQKVDGLQEERTYLFNKLSTENKYLQEENKRLNNIIVIMEKYFELIVDLGYDYDELNSIENLKGLIDELVRFASLGRVYNTTETIYVNQDKKYNILNEELKGDNK